MRDAGIKSLCLIGILFGCSVQTEQRQAAGFYPTECADDTPAIACGIGLNEYSAGTSALVTGRPWFAFKYMSAASYVIGKVCIAASVDGPTSVYLLNDNAGYPGDVLEYWPLYADGDPFVCTNDEPSAFTAEVESGKTYWIASNASAPLSAHSGFSVPYWTSDIEPGESPTWTSNCSARFIATISPKGTCK